MKTAIAMILLLSALPVQAEKGANDPRYCNRGKVTTKPNVKKDKEDTWLVFCVPSAKDGFAKGFVVKGGPKDVTITNGWPGPAAQGAGTAPFNETITIVYEETPALRFTVVDYDKKPDDKSIQSFVLKKGAGKGTFKVDSAYDVNISGTKLRSGEFVVAVSVESDDAEKKPMNPEDEEVTMDADLLRSIQADPGNLPLPSLPSNEPVPQMEPLNKIPFNPAPNAPDGAVQLEPEMPRSVLPPQPGVAKPDAVAPNRIPAAFPDGEPDYGPAKAW